MNLGARLLLAAVWLFHWLPLGVQAALGRGLGVLLFQLARGRREVALRNVALCLPELAAQEQLELVRAHFKWLARSMLEHGMLWHASAARLRRLIHVQGDVHLAEHSARPVMWLAPHFVALEVGGAATQIYQTRTGIDVYTQQSNAVLDAALLRGRARFGRALMLSRQQGALPLVRAIKEGNAFFNAADMDFGLRDAAFVPFFGHPAATLLAPSRLARKLGMVVQPVVTHMLPGGQGWQVHFMPPWDDWPSDDAQADAARMNRFIEEQVRLCPEQYLWVHKRFKTRPPGADPLY
jgi:KDO2-lipid IV(A) lauroyltransferase